MSTESATSAANRTSGKTFVAAAAVSMSLLAATLVGCSSASSTVDECLFSESELSAVFDAPATTLVDTDWPLEFGVYHDVPTTHCGFSIGVPEPRPDIDDVSVWSIAPGDQALRDEFFNSAWGSGENSGLSQDSAIARVETNDRWYHIEIRFARSDDNLASGRDIEYTEDERLAYLDALTDLLDG